MKQGNTDLLAQFNRCLETVIHREKWQIQERKRREVRPVFVERLERKETLKLPKLVVNKGDRKAEERGKEDLSDRKRGKVRAKRNIPLSHSPLSHSKDLGVFGTTKPRLQPRARQLRLPPCDVSPVMGRTQNSTLKPRVLHSELHYADLEGWEGDEQEENHWLEQTFT